MFTFLTSKEASVRGDVEKTKAGSLFGSFLALLALCVFASFLMGRVPSAGADEANDLCNNMNAEMQTHEAAEIVRRYDSWNQDLANNTASKLRGDVKKKQCIAFVFTFYQTIRDLLSGISAIVKAIEALIQSLLEQVCQYIVTAINNALASVCIPLPSLSLSLSLPSMSSTSCSGLSLLNVLKATSGGTTTSSSSSSGSMTINPSSFFGYPLIRGDSTDQ